MHDRYPKTGSANQIQNQKKVSIQVRPNLNLDTAQPRLIVNCTWSAWGEWGSCQFGFRRQEDWRQETGRIGQQIRTREEASPSENGGTDCSINDAIEFRECSSGNV